MLLLICVRVELLLTLSVDKGYRRCSVGSRLLESMEDVLRSEGVYTIALSVKRDNYSALGFYIRHGYSVKGVVLLLSACVDKIHVEPITEYSIVVEKLETLFLQN